MTITNTQIETFEPFGNDFQEKLALLIFKDRQFSDQIREVLEISYFERTPLQAFVRKVIEYREKYNKMPTINTMKTIIKLDFKGEGESLLQGEVNSFFEKCLTDKGHLKEVVDEEYIKEKSLDFCKKQNLKKAFFKAIDCAEKSSFDDISKIINDALKLGGDNQCGHCLIEDFEERYKPHMRHPVSTGWQQMDNITGGGLGRKELGIIIAPSGAGKSFLGVHLGAQALKEGKTVIHYTLELSDTNIGLRYDSCITGVNLKDLHACKDEIYKTISEIKGKLIIKEYHTKSASTQTIRRHLEKCKSLDIYPELIIIDYADLLKSTTTYNEKRFDLESIIEDLRAIMQENDCPGWTFSQTNRSGLEEEVITMSSISEAFNKCFPADFIFTMSRSREDKNANTGRFYIAKSRLGPDGIVFPIFFNPANAKIKMLPPDDFVPTEILEERNKSSNLTNLKEKYKQHLQEKNGKRMN